MAKVNVFVFFKNYWDMLQVILHTAQMIKLNL